MFCPKCGSNIPENSQFCLNCGTAIQQTAPTISDEAATVQLDADESAYTNVGAFSSQNTGTDPVDSSYSADTSYSEPYSDPYADPYADSRPVSRDFDRDYDRDYDRGYRDSRYDRYDDRRKPSNNNKVMIGIIAAVAVLVVAAVIVVVCVLSCNGNKGGSSGGNNSSGVNPVPTAAPTPDRSQLIQGSWTVVGGGGTADITINTITIRNAMGSSLTYQYSISGNNLVLSYQGASENYTYQDVDESSLSSGVSPFGSSKNWYVSEDYLVMDSAVFER